MMYYVTIYKIIIKNKAHYLVKEVGRPWVLSAALMCVFGVDYYGDENEIDATQWNLIDTDGNIVRVIPDEFAEDFAEILCGEDFHILVDEMAGEYPVRELRVVEGVSSKRLRLVPAFKGRLFFDISEERIAEGRGSVLQFLPSIHGNCGETWTTVVNSVTAPSVDELAEMYGQSAGYNRAKKILGREYDFLIYVVESGKILISDSKYFTYDTSRPIRIV